ncbi:hypothetical protein GQ53DRAFT_591448, partial [Thozetella sp. PMI_491]
MASGYPEPFIVPPRRLPHKQTFIILHGRGSWGEKFGQAFIDWPIVSAPLPTSSEEPALNSITTRTIVSAFPHARFVFPSAARRRATIYRRAYTRQWFDSWKLDPPATDREELQIPGLHETTEYIHGLLRAEIAAVPGGAANIVLGGLSQGCAVSLVSLLLWKGDPLAAAFGMCGWLPYADRLRDEFLGAEAKHSEPDKQSDELDFDPFERDDGDGNTGPPPELVSVAIRWLREELEAASQSTDMFKRGFQQVPIFLGHGVVDEKVSIILGRNAASSLGILGID